MEVWELKLYFCPSAVGFKKKKEKKRKKAMKYSNGTVAGSINVL